MTIQLIKMTNDTDIIAKVIPQPNKFIDVLKLQYPMVINTDDYDGYPLISLRMMNFYGKAAEIDLPLSSILYQTTPRAALEQFYEHTVTSYFERFNLQIDSMLERVYKQYIEDTATSTDNQQFLNLLKKMTSSSNTTFQ